MPEEQSSVISNEFTFLFAANKGSEDAKAVVILTIMSEAETQLQVMDYLDSVRCRGLLVSCV